MYHCGGDTDKPHAHTFSDSSCPSAQTCFATIPGNSSAFLFSAEGGLMKRVVRYGARTSRIKARDRWCDDFSRHTGKIVDVSRGAESKHDDFSFDTSPSHASSYQPSITCISVNNSVHFDSKAMKGDSMSPLVLVGRSDGTIDLFRLDAPDPIQSWELSLYSKHSRPKSELDSSSATVYVQWATWDALASFVAADAVGVIYYFDILKQPSQPIYVDSMNTPLTTSSVKLSSCRSKGMSVYMVVGNSQVSVSRGGLRIRKIDDGVSSGHDASKNKENEENKTEDDGVFITPPHWESWVGRTTIEVAPWKSN